MRRLFDSFLVLQGRSTGTTPMAGGQSLRLLALSSAQSSAAHPLGRPLALHLGHSVAWSLFRSFSRPARSPLRSTARPLVRPLAWSRARSSPCSLASSFDRSLVCLLANAGSRACWFGSPPRSFTFALMSSRASMRSFARAQSLVPAFARLLGPSFGRPLVFLVARSSIRLVALSLIRLLIERGFASHSAVYAFHHKLD